MLITGYGEIRLYCFMLIQFHRFLSKLYFHGDQLGSIVSFKDIPEISETYITTNTRTIGFIATIPPSRASQDQASIKLDYTPGRITTQV